MVDLEQEQARVAAAESKLDAAIAKLDAVALEAETRQPDRADALKAQRDVAQAGLVASRAAHREALLREHVGRQELLRLLADVTAERDALIAKYEPERLPKDDPAADSVEASERLR